MNFFLRKFDVSYLSRVACFVAMTSSSLFAQQPEPKIVGASIGFGGSYKLGCWTPLEVDLVGGTEACTGRVMATVPDSDGVPTTVVTPTSRPVGIVPGTTTTVRLLVRIGQSHSSLSVRFVSDDRKLKSQRTFYAGLEAGPGVVTGGLPATQRLLLEFGPSVGLTDLLQEASEDDLSSTTRARVESAAQLPTRWIGYESVDTVFLTTSQVKLYRPLLQNRVRVEALRLWVENGGKLVIFCGAEADELLGEDGALASLVPGNYVKLEKLGQSQPLETFSGAEQPVTPSRRLNLPVPRLTNVKGRILASIGRGESLLPLVVRSRLGVGEVVFVGLDFDRDPLRKWLGRVSFLRKVLNWKEHNVEDLQASPIYGEAPGDLIGQLRTSLDEKFIGVQLIPFSLVALLVVGYILLIGPGDYLIVKRVLKRMELTWVTFPLIVLGVSAAAYWFANWNKGDQLRVNQVEVVDVDTSTGIARGMVWTHFFTPQVEQYDLTLRPSFLQQGSPGDSDTVVSWLGLPGYALGGMQARGTQTTVFDTGYTYGDRLQSMDNVPVQLWSTKTITARWTASVETPLKFHLQQTGGELLNGNIENTSGIEWEDCLLLYGRWAFHLGRIAHEGTVSIDDSIQPRTVKTLLTSATAGDTTITNTADDGTVPFRRASSDIARLAKLAMFYKAVNGYRYTGMLHRYQSFSDLSHLLSYEDQAILLARSTKEGSLWYDGEQPLRSDEDRRWTYFRLLLPVEQK